MARIDGRTKLGVIGWTLLAGFALVAGAVAQPAEPAIRPPAAAAPPDDGQWTMPAKNYASTRYSELAEITEDNVKTLQVAFTFSTGVNKGQEAAPLVVGDAMYIVTPFPNILYALDLARPGAPMKWKFEPNPEPAAQGVACCDVVNRGAAFSNGRLYFNTLDGHTIAVDAATGKPVWNTQIGNINIGETITMAPLVVKGKVLVGNSGGEMGVRGWIKALDAGDGHVIWTAYSTGPDAEVLIGPDFKPHYDMDKGKDLGVSSWPPDAWKVGGGNVWGWISYDPDLDLIFHGTGNPGPWNPDLRPGDNKWTSGIFARDPDTGTAKWFYQWTPHDLHDYDGINEQVLLDMTWQGKPRKVLVRPERNGYVYMLDRMTGEVLSAVPFGPVNSSKGVDLKTGRLIANPEKETGTGKVVRNICPTASGLKDWQPSAFSPKTGLLYIPHSNLCMDEEGVEVNYIAGTPYVGMNVRMIPGPGGHRGVFTAWDVAAAKPAWILKENFPVWSGAVVTAGNVVFYGTMEGWFKAVSATTGKLLWQFKTSSGIIGQPITYRGPDGHQYVAILSGVGGWAGAIVSGDLDPRDATAALGFANVMKDLKDVTTPGGTLYVFRLP
ncbi:methanol/ethanol family PQQ-dependent dehydrogenase [Mesorhizobium sp. L48C026A00]|uniref:methanol/ethanol family PQQ-dependent dehydrogenase n=1 Tax=Mesorhizobium sp. L48C026A00 TaxID=1287182 RepID=UPI0004095731|nr:methanol/ethanol family PQQ-dependent dehydrogenase [Mesorhizobium sp. L48C026A00]